MEKISASQAAELLGVSVGKLEILEKQGLIHSTQNADGVIYYSSEEIGHIKSRRGITIADEASIVNSKIQLDTASSISLFHKVLIAGGSFISGYLALAVVFMVLFINYPLQTSDFFGYYYRPNTESRLQSSSSITEDTNVLAASIGPSATSTTQTSVLADMVKPIADTSLIAVKAIDNQKHFQIVTPPDVADITLPTQSPILPEVTTDTNTITGLSASNLTAGDFSSKVNSGTYSINISGNALTSTTATNFSGSLLGDVTGTEGSTTVAKINGAVLGTTTATVGNVLIGDGTSWVTRALSSDATINSSGVLTLKNTGTAGTYGSATQIPVLTTDAQGRVTSVTNTTISGLTNSNLSGSASITNANLANSSITTAGNSGSGSVSLGGGLTFTGSGITNIVASGSTLTVTSTEADTLATVTGRGASTSTALTLNGGVTTTTSTALTLDSGTTGGISIGTGANAKIITIGNTTGATAVNINSGTGNINFTVDGTGTSGKVQIGNSGSATPDLLVLDNGTADPTGVNGGMYYNTTTGKLRCYQSSAWDDCVTDTTENLKLTYKTANQTNTTTTLVDDTDLKFNVGANETWTFRFSLQLNSPSPADTKWNISTPAGVTNCKYAVTVYRNNTNTTSNVSCGTAATGIATTGNDEVIEVMGTIENGSTAGTVQLQWAEDSSNGTMTVYRDSFLLSGKSTGADLAEMYATNDSSIEAADVVSLDGTLTAGVKKSSRAYDREVFGVISTHPALVMGIASDTQGLKEVPVALSGRVPVKVSTENGKIYAGDYLTTSSTPGVAMKATKTGAIIGTAMASFDGQGIGQIMIFIKNGSSVGTSSEGIDVLMQLLSQPNIELDNPTAGAIEIPEAKSIIETNLIGYITQAISNVFKKSVEFFGSVVFRGDIAFLGRPIFNKDTAGHTFIKAGDSEISINFAKEYSKNPVVTTSINFTSGVKMEEMPSYAVYDLSSKGFKIKLSKAAPLNLSFSWVALAVNEDNQLPPTPFLNPSVSQDLTSSPEATESASASGQLIP